MKKLIFSFILCLAASSALADDEAQRKADEFWDQQPSGETGNAPQGQEPGTEGQQPPPGISTGWGTGGFNSPFAVELHAGLMSFEQGNDDLTRRFATGVLFDFNAAPIFTPSEGESSLYYGLTSGVIYSTVGSSGAGFFGSTDAATGRGNLWMIPAQIFGGYNFTERVMASLSAGGNVMYRTNAQAINLDGDTSPADNEWNFFPSVGAEIGYGFADRFGLVLRGDLTFTPGTDPFVATLGATIPLG